MQAEVAMERKGLSLVTQAYTTTQYHVWATTGVQPKSVETKGDKDVKWQGRTLQAMMVKSCYRLLGKPLPPIKGSPIAEGAEGFDSAGVDSKCLLVVFCSAENDDSMRALSDMSALASMDKNVSAVGVTVDQDEAKLKAFSRYKKTPVIHDNTRRLEARFNVRLLPQICVVVDGEVKDVVVGYSSSVSRSIKSELRKK